MPSATARPSTFVLTVDAGGTAAGDFSVAANPASISLAPGQRGATAISIARTGGFAGHVSLAVSGVPAGASPGGGLAASDKSRILQWLSCGLPL